MAPKEKEKRMYTKSEIIFGNLAIIIWILLGTAACWLFNVFGAVGFLALSGFLVYYELGKKGCLSCYYCKTCTIGMGKLPDVFFTKAGTENLNRKALKLFPYVYLLMAPVPTVLISVSIFQEYSVFKLTLLAALLAFSVFSGMIRRKILVH
jgi:hypothetical protein